MWHARMMHLSMALALLIGGFVLDNTDASLMHHGTYVDGSVVRS
jgi:hypothetical protein